MASTKTRTKEAAPRDTRANSTLHTDPGVTQKPAAKESVRINCKSFVINYAGRHYGPGPADAPNKEAADRIKAAVQRAEERQSKITGNIRMQLHAADEEDDEEQGSPAPPEPGESPLVDPTIPPESKPQTPEEMFRLTEDTDEEDEDEEPPAT